MPRKGKVRGSAKRRSDGRESRRASRSVSRGERVLVLHGPNLNLLGSRETGIYGTTSLAEINRTLKKEARGLGLEISSVQSNSEGELIGHVQKADRRFAGILINPAGLTHTSVALRDALAAVSVPSVEVHLTNIFARESFRQTSITAPACAGIVAGFGPAAYEVGLRALAGLITGVR